MSLEAVAGIGNVVIFDSENELKAAYEIMKADSKTIVPTAPI
jgi:hypothetical protein